MDGQGRVSNCYSTAEVSGSNYTGGIAGSTEGGISNCAALNPSVKGSNNTGRVTGSAQTSAAPSNNIAFANLLNQMDNRNWNKKGSAAIDGEDIQPSDIHADSTLGGRFVGSPWVTAAGKLPGIGSAVDMPEHIADFYILRYVIPPACGALANGDTEQTIRAGADGRAVTVIGKDGYTFYQWSDSSTDNPRQDTAIWGDITIFAYFMDEEGNVSVKTVDRKVPAVPPKEDAAVIAPITIISGEFTAGPNPVVKQSGIVNFFRQGKRVSNSELRIYDATGNIINSVKISDRALNNQARRQVGSWDLCDRNGRIVPEGTYLVKGVVKTSDGKKEKVSLIIGVR
jgi:hypothetical protein